MGHITPVSLLITSIKINTKFAIKQEADARRRHVVFNINYDIFITILLYISCVMPLIAHTLDFSNQYANILKQMPSLVHITVDLKKI